MGVNLYDNNTYYRISMIDLDSIKNHLLSLFLKYFFIYYNTNCEDIAITFPNTIIVSYNGDKLFQDENDMIIGDSNSSMNFSLVQLHETGHGKFNSSCDGLNSPRYFLNSSFNPIEQKTWEEEKINLDEFLSITNNEKKEFFVFKGESGKCIDNYLYNKMPLIIFGLIKCNNLKNIENTNLFTGPSLIPLYKKIEEIALDKKPIKKEEEKKEKTIIKKANMNKIKMNQSNNNQYEDIGDKFLKLNLEQRKQLLNYLYPKEKKEEIDDNDNKIYTIDFSKKVKTKRSDYGIFIISN